MLCSFAQSLAYPSYSVNERICSIAHFAAERVGQDATKGGVRYSTIWAFVFFWGDLLC